jgi:hypothetical protein
MGEMCAVARAVAIMRDEPPVHLAAAAQSSPTRRVRGATRPFNSAKREGSLSVRRDWRDDGTRNIISRYPLPPQAGEILVTWRVLDVLSRH